MPKTQTEKVLQLAKSQKKFSSWDLIHLGITQQNARIHDARKQLGCVCGDRDKKGLIPCYAKEHIRCLKDNQYEYLSDEVVKPVFSPQSLQSGEIVQNIPKMEEPTTPGELKGQAKQSWEAMKAYFRGEGPKPEIKPTFEQVVQEALL